MVRSHEIDGYSGLGHFGCGAGCPCDACRQRPGLAEYYYEGEGRDPPRVNGLRGRSRPAFLSGAQAHGFLGELPAPAPVAPPLSVGSGGMVRVANAGLAPFRCICRIETRSYDKPRCVSVGTGFLVSPFHVLTVAHNIYPPESPHTKTIDVYPAQNGPVESVVRFSANGWAIRPGCRPNDCRTAGGDYGIIRLAAPAPHGFFPLRSFDPTILSSRRVQLAGYPYDREPRAQHMYRSEGAVTGAVMIQSCGVNAQGKPTLRGTIVPLISSSLGLFAHGLPSSHGVSGGPMWIEENSARTLIGIHVRDIDDERRRAGVLLDDTVRAQVMQWMNRELPSLRR